MTKMNPTTRDRANQFPPTNQNHTNETINRLLSKHNEPHQRRQPNQSRPTSLRLHSAFNGQRRGRRDGVSLLNKIIPATTPNNLFYKESEREWVGKP